MLVVVNLLPTTLFARLDDNIVSTVRYKCSKSPNIFSLTMLLAFCLHVTSSRSTWYGGGSTLSSPRPRCTALREVVGQVHDADRAFVFIFSGQANALTIS